MYKLNKFENFRMMKQTKEMLRALYVVEIRIDIAVYNNQ